MMEVILVLNLLAALAVGVYNRRHKGRAVCCVLLIICVPVFGLLFTYSWQFIKRLFSHKEYIDDKPDKSEKRQLFHDYRTAAAEVVPLYDVLALENFTDKRKLLTDAIKEESLSNQHILKQAVGDNDREVSHYAATMLTDRIEKLQRRIYTEKAEPEELTEELEQLFDKAEAMQNYLVLGFMDEKSRQNKLREYAVILEDILTKWHQEPKYFVDRINLAIENAELIKAEEYCRLYQKYFPNTEEVYLLQVKLYHKQKNKTKLMQAINDLRDCPVVLSAEGLRLIRFWGGK